MLMLYQLAHILRDRFTWLWNILGVVLSWLFSIRYGRRLKQIPIVLSKHSQQNPLGLSLEALCRENVSALAKMLSEQPDEAFTYFRPHGFSLKALSVLVRDSGFLAFVVKDGDQVVGYIFQRSFFWGKAYRGYITDYRWQRRGINKMMNTCVTEISSLLGLKVYGTISPENVASLKSAESANEVKVVKTLKNGDYFVQYLPK